MVVVGRSGSDGSQAEVALARNVHGRNATAIAIAITTTLATAIAIATATATLAQINYSRISFR